MKSVGTTAKIAIIGSAAGCLLLSGAAAASAATAVPAGSPVDCLTPALSDPEGAVTGTLEDPAGSLQADAACLSGQD